MKIIELRIRNSSQVMAVAITEGYSETENRYREEEAYRRLLANAAKYLIESGTIMITERGINDDISTDNPSTYRYYTSP